MVLTGLRGPFCRHSLSRIVLLDVNIRCQYLLPTLIVGDRMDMFVLTLFNGLRHAADPFKRKRRSLGSIWGSGCTIFGDLWALEGSILGCHGQFFLDLASSWHLGVAHGSILMPTWDSHAPFSCTGKPQYVPFGLPNETQNGDKVISYQKVKIELSLQPELDLEGREGCRISQFGVPCGRAAEGLLLDGVP